MICVDFETTGLTKPNRPVEEQPGIVQIGLIKTDANWNVVGEYQWRVNPEMPIEPEAIAVHGITGDMVAHEKTIPALHLTLARLFLCESVWIGFNNDFDRTVLSNVLIKYGLANKFPWPFKDIDVMRWGKDYCSMAGKKDMKFPKLIELHQHIFKTGFDQAHDALADCRATVRCGAHLAAEGYMV